MDNYKIIKKIAIYSSNLISFIITSCYGFNKPDNYKNSILIIETEKLGDIILSADFLVSLRKKNEYEKYDLLIPESYINLFDWKEIGYNAITINKRKYRYNLSYRLKFINLIRGNRYEHVINITQERGMINDELAIISGSSRKTAMKDSSLYLPKIFLNRNNKHYTEIPDALSTNEYDRLLHFLSLNKISLETRNNIFGIENVSIDAIDNRLINKDYIIIAPMSSEMDRSWGIENYKQLCTQLEGDIILIGKEDERTQLDLICSAGKNIRNFGGKLSFKQIAYLIKNCSLYIGNDSGLTHLALQLGSPLIAIIGGGKYGKFFPYKERKDAIFMFSQMDCFGCDWNCIHDRKYCLINVTPAFVIEKVNLLKAATL